MPPDLLYLLQTIRDEQRSIKRLLTSLRKDVGLIITWGTRGGLVAALWMSALWLNATAEEKAAIAAALARSLIGS
jgi:hypothetical protein